MATLPNPKGLAAPPAITTDTFARPASEFDAGINASTAWVAEQADKSAAGHSLSDDEEEIDIGTGRAARALYDFEGKPEFRELTLSAGDELDILKEELDDGWSLANMDGKVGLIPRTYYAVCVLCIGIHCKPDPDISLHPRWYLRPPFCLMNIPNTTEQAQATP